MSKDGTLHLVYWREYYDDEDHDWFPIYHTIFRNVPLSQLQRLNSKELKEKVKVYCDKNFNETASNFTGDSGVDMITGSEYYKTYADEYGPIGNLDDDNSFFTDYGQKWNGRQFFKKDYNPEFTKTLTRSLL
tara:strand:- start:271 stop:666 length:396 start_codon:yes stop_codon:yes gene_type:complete